MNDNRIHGMLQRAMISQIKRYNALPHLRRRRGYGRWLYADIRKLSDTLLNLYVNE